MRIPSSLTGFLLLQWWEMLVGALCMAEPCCKQYWGWVNRGEVWEQVREASENLAGFMKIIVIIFIYISCRKISVPPCTGGKSWWWGHGRAGEGNWHAAFCEGFRWELHPRHPIGAVLDRNMLANLKSLNVEARWTRMSGHWLIWRFLPHGAWEMATRGWFGPETKDSVGWRGPHTLT